MWRSLFVAAFLMLAFSAVAETDESGLAVDESLALVKGHCLACHSAQLITQNRLSREGWLRTIRYMQKNHNLWDLGEMEKPVLDYLAKHYSSKPTTQVRRKNLPYLPGGE